MFYVRLNGKIYQVYNVKDTIDGLKFLVYIDENWSYIEGDLCTPLFITK